MANTAQETFVVTGMGQYGPKVNGKNYNWSKKIKPEQKALVVEGNQVTAEIYTADSGAKYINSVLSSVKASLPSSTPAPTTTAAPAASAPVAHDTPKSETDWDKINRGKTACVLYEAALQSMALANFATANVEEYLALVEKTVERGVKFVFGDK